MGRVVGLRHPDGGEVRHLGRDDLRPAADGCGVRVRRPARSRLALAARASSLAALGRRRAPRPCGNRRRGRRRRLAGRLRPCGGGLAAACAIGLAVGAVGWGVYVTQTGVVESNHVGWRRSFYAVPGLYAPRRPSLRSLFAELRAALAQGHVPGCRGALALPARDYTLSPCRSPPLLLPAAARAVGIVFQTSPFFFNDSRRSRCCCALAASSSSLFGGWVTYEVMWMLGYAELLPIDVFAC